MNTYNLTEIELQQWGNQIKEACANNAKIMHFRSGDEIDGRVDKEAIIKTPLPPLPISGAKKEDIPECPNCKEKTKPCACERNICMKCGEPVGNITFTVCDNCWDKKKEVEQPVPSIENYGEPERGINIISPTAEQGAEPVASHSVYDNNSIEQLKQLVFKHMDEAIKYECEVVLFPQRMQGRFGNSMSYKQALESYTCVLLSKIEETVSTKQTK